MNEIDLIKKYAGIEADVLPVYYEKIQFDEIGEKNLYFNSSSIYSESKRHQTKKLVSARFYKPISFFEI